MVEKVAECFQVWIGQEDWESDVYRFYRSLDRAMAVSERGLNESLIFRALHAAYAEARPDSQRDPLELQLFVIKAMAVLDYLRATR